MNPRALQWIAKLMTASLVIAFGLQLAWWTWHFILPPWRQADAGTATQADTVDLRLGRQLFGDKDGAPLSPQSLSPAPAGNIRLKGVFAVDGKTLSAAVVNLGGRDQTVRTNQELSAGVKLLEVHPEFIVVSRSGARERIDLDRPGNRPITPGGSTSASGPAPTNFRLNVASTGANAFALSRQELNTVLQDQRQMNFLGRIGPAASGGVRVEDSPAGSLANKLGLQAGDVITSINGQPINSQGDLVRVYAQFGSISAIRAEVKRGGSPVVLSYSIQN